MSAYRVDPERGIVFGKQGAPIRKRTSTGYVTVKNHSGHVAQVHRMVWEAVHGPIPEGMQINHKNGIKHDNRIANLELVTPSENTLHSYRMNLRCAKGENNGRAKLTEASVRAIRRSSEPTRVLADRYGVSMTTIQDVRAFRKWRNVA